MSTPPRQARLALRTGVRHGRAAVGIVAAAAPGAMLGLSTLTVLGGLAPVAAAWLVKLVLDQLVSGGSGWVLTWLAVALAGTGVATATLPQANQYVTAAMGRAVRLRTFDRLFRRLATRLRGLARLEEPRFHDRLQLAKEGGSGAPGSIVATTLGIGQESLKISGFLATLLIINPWLAAVVMAAGAPTVRAEVLLARHRVKALGRIVYASRRQSFYANLLSFPQEAKEVRLFGLGGFFRDRMLSQVRSINDTERVVERRELAIQATLGGVGAVVAGGGLIWATQAASTGALTVGDITAFVAALAGVQGGWSGVIGRYGKLYEALLMFDHYQAVVTVEPDLPVPARPTPPAELAEAIEVQDVWFRYGPKLPWVLRGVDLTLRSGRSVAIVGLNGAGKSTLVKLLCRLYDPTYGQITWDGVDLRDMDPAALRERIAAVFQDYVQYEMTAAENIGVGDLALLDERQSIEDAARRAGIHKALTTLPAGYDTMLTRMFVDRADRDDPGTGVLLSGGQGQRLALARMFLRNQRDLLVLDEPSSGLDAEAEAEIHTRLRTQRAGRTSLLISHRLNTVRDADEIVVIRDGQVVEQGDHATLMSRGGGYAQLFALQARGYNEPVVVSG